MYTAGRWSSVWGESDLRELLTPVRTDSTLDSHGIPVSHVSVSHSSHDAEQGWPMVADPVIDTSATAPRLDSPSARTPVTPRRRNLGATLWRFRALYLMALPGIAYFLLFKYVPMGGLIISFQDYKPFLGIMDSPWVGFEHFVRLFTENTFTMLLRNTLVLSILLMLISFPVPIILALLLNELRSKVFQRSVQTIIYIPHFMSWVIVVSIFYVMLTIDGGAINNLIQQMGGQPIGFLTDPEWLRPMYVFQHVWRTAGWGTIVYLAALTAVDLSLYEAAEIDGANRWKQTWHITLPAIRPTIIVLFILSIGDFLDRKSTRLNSS